MTAAGHRRILGLETEVGVLCTARSPRGERLGADDVAGLLFRSVVARAGSSSVFLDNGARLYLDVGNHPEYATAECRDVDTLVAHDRAGELELLALADDAERQLAETGTPGRVHLLKNNVDSAGHSYGCHENYLVRRGDLAALSEGLVPFLVTRQLLCGAGGVGVDEQGRPAFHLSQRAEHMDEAVSSATTRSRPIINARDEPHADAERYRRLHVIVGDSTMLEPTTRLKVGSCDLVLRLVEAGVVLRDLALESPLAAIRTVSADPGGRALLRLADGRRASALDLQEAWLGRVHKHLDREGASPTDEAVVDLWGRVLQAVGDDEPHRVATEIEWAAKQQLLTRAAERAGADLTHPSVRALALAWHDIHPDRGVLRQLERQGLAARLTTDEQVQAARVEPPATRAALRSRFLRAARAARRDHVVDWVHLRVLDGQPRTVALHDPFATDDARVDRVITELLPAARGGAPSQHPASAP